MKFNFIFSLFLGLTLACQSSAESFKNHKKIQKEVPKKIQKEVPSAVGSRATQPDKNIIGKTPADKSVEWEYTVMLTDASSTDIETVKEALKKEGKLTWGKLDEPRFGVRTYLSEDEIKALSEKITEVTPKEVTNKLMITLNQNKSWPALKKILTENRMQVYHINGDWNRPFQVAVKTPNMPVGMVYAVMGKYIDSEKGGVEEVK